MTVTNTRLRTGIYSILERITSSDSGDGTTRSIRVTAAQAPDFLRRLMDTAKQALGLSTDAALANQQLTMNQALSANAIRSVEYTSMSATPNFGVPGNTPVLQFENATPPTYVDFPLSVYAPQEDMIWEIKVGHSIDG